MFIEVICSKGASKQRSSTPTALQNILQAE